MKRCARCHEEKPLEQFARAATARDGRQSYCRGCKAAWAKTKYHSDIATARERVRIKMREFRATHPVWWREYMRDWRDRNRHLVRAAGARRRAKPEAKAWHAAYWKEWKRRNPEQTRLIARRGQQTRRARLNGAFVESVDALIVLDRGQGICGICLEPVDPAEFHVDHIIPLAAGGEHSYANTQPAHPRCNISKGARVQAVAA